MTDEENKETVKIFIPYFGDEVGYFTREIPLNTTFGRFLSALQTAKEGDRISLATGEKIDD